MNNPKFSVIIPTYNRVNQIKDAIKSVLEQTLQSFEIILLNYIENHHKRKKQ